MATPAKSLSERGSALALMNWTNERRRLAILGRASLRYMKHGFDIPANIQSEFSNSCDPAEPDYHISGTAFIRHWNICQKFS
jgi:hypothetical protein